MGLKQPWGREAGCSGVETRPGPGYNDTECGVWAKLQALVYGILPPAKLITP